MSDFIRYFEVFGYRFKLCFDNGVDPKWIEQVIYPGRLIRSSEDVLGTYLFRSNGSAGLNGLYWNGELICPIDRFDASSVKAAEGMMQINLACISSSKLTLVHAGAVSVKGTGILIPGKTRSGKSTLTKCFLDHGAEYLTDDCAVVGQDGRVVPYPAPLKLRNPHSTLETLLPAGTGFAVASGPVDVKVVLITRFHADSRWDPREISKGEATMDLLGNLFYLPAMRESPGLTLGMIENLLDSATIFSGNRGDAKEVVDFVLRLV